MTYRVLCVTDKSDLPETELFIGLKNAGVDIEVVSNPNGKHYFRLKNAGVKTHEIILSTRFSLLGITRVYKLLKKNHYDILYCFNNKAVSNVLLASWGMKFKLVTYRGTIGNVSFLSLASWTTHLHPRVDRIICVSNAVRDYLVKMRLFWLKIPEKNLISIYKGHKISWYQKLPADLSEFNISYKDFVIGFAGRNRPHKGINFLIDSAKWLPQNAAIHYLLLGKLKSDKNLLKQIQTSPFKDRIHLAGYRNNAPMIAAACDVFIMPSTKREGLSRAIIEAMACATVPVVSDVGGLPELVIDDESGFVVPPKDSKSIAMAIMKLYNNPDKKKKMGKQAQDRIKTVFNIQSTIENTKRMFEELVCE